ncbi:hypothetical protein DIPPA_10096 [Diplonema papillatum]|nr:hypothetical protein DIPPA_10096 [Diplonema papillatum]
MRKTARNALDFLPARLKKGAAAVPPPPSIEEGSEGAVRFKRFLAVRGATNPAWLGLSADVENSRDYFKALGQVARAGGETISSNVSSVLIENLEDLSDQQFCGCVVTLSLTADHGRYTGRGNTERSAVDVLLASRERLLRQSLRVIAAGAEIFLTAGVHATDSVHEIVDEVIDRISENRVRDYSSLVRILSLLAKFDFESATLFSVCQCELAMNIDKVGAGSLPNLITAFANAAVPAEDIQAAIARRAPDIDPEINRRIDKALAIAQRHKVIPMINRGAQQEWLNIPGFAQKKRKR